MKSIIKTIMAAAIAAGLATSASAAPPGKGPLETTIHKSPMTLGLATTNATSQQYTCPMHPEVVRDTPGKCPRCGMKLVEKNDAKKVGKCCGNKESMFIIPVKD